MNLNVVPPEDKKKKKHWLDAGGRRKFCGKMRHRTLSRHQPYRMGAAKEVNYAIMKT